MLKYGKESWFRRWIDHYVLKVSLDDSIRGMQEETGVTLTEEEKEYYQFLIDKMRSKILSVCELNYDKELVQKVQQEKLGDKILRARDRISDKFVGIRNFVGRLTSEDSDVR